MNRYEQVKDCTKAAFGCHKSKKPKALISALGFNTTETTKRGTLDSLIGPLRYRQTEYSDCALPTGNRVLVDSVSQGWRE